MDLYKLKEDPRIIIKTHITEAGEHETYPLNSFTFECFLSISETPLAVYTSHTSNPNHYYTSVPKGRKKIHKLLVAAKQERFYFFETTLWGHEKKSQTLQLFNILKNSRWTLIFKNNPTIESLPQYPSAVWPLRELKDMFNVPVLNLKDSRRLLLDYKTSRGAMNPKTITKKALYSTINGVYYA